jgi:hypothetical protein
MALFHNVPIHFTLTKLRVFEHYDRWSGVEPYVIPVFFKIDGDRYSAVLRVFNTQPADEDTTEVTETTPIQFELETNPEDNPPIFFPASNILRPARQQDIQNDEEIDISDIELTTILRPIPFRIDILGIWDLIDLLHQPIVTATLDGFPTGLLNLAFDGVSELIGKAVGLDEEFDSCPDIEWSEDFINAIEAQFEGLIPGTVGGLFVVMENDDMDEDDVRVMQDSIVVILREQINNITNSITRVNPIPETDISTELQDTNSLLAEIVLNLALRLDPGFWGIGTLGWLIGSPDDFIHTYLRIYDHMLINDMDEDGDLFSETFTDPEQENRWKISGRLELT